MFINISITLQSNRHVRQ